MKRVLLSRRAESDLAAILSHIAGDSPRQAVIVTDRLEAAAMDLADTWAHYPRVDLARYPDVRRRTVGSYNLFYLVEDDDVYVLHIVHGSRDIESLFSS